MDFEKIDRNTRELEDQLVVVKYMGIRSLLIAGAVFVNLPLSLLHWGWPGGVALLLLTASLWNSFRLHFVRKKIKNRVEEIQGQLNS